MDLSSKRLRGSDLGDSEPTVVFGEDGEDTIGPSNSNSIAQLTIIGVPMPKVYGMDSAPLWLHHNQTHSIVFAKDTPDNMRKRFEADESTLPAMHAIPIACLNLIMRNRFFEYLNALDKYEYANPDWKACLWHCLDGFAPLGISKQPMGSIPVQEKRANVIRKMVVYKRGMTGISNLFGPNVLPGDHIYLVAKFVPDDPNFTLGDDSKIVSTSTRLLDLKPQPGPVKAVSKAVSKASKTSKKKIDFFSSKTKPSPAKITISEEDAENVKTVLDNMREMEKVVQSAISTNAFAEFVENLQPMGYTDFNEKTLDEVSLQVAIITTFCYSIARIGKAAISLGKVSPSEVSTLVETLNIALLTLMDFLEDLPKGNEKTSIALREGAKDIKEELRNDLGALSAQSKTWKEKTVADDFKNAYDVLGKRFFEWYLKSRSTQGEEPTDSDEEKAKKKTEFAILEEVIQVMHDEFASMKLPKIDSDYIEASADALRSWVYDFQDLSEFERDSATVSEEAMQEARLDLGNSNIRLWSSTSAYSSQLVSGAYNKSRTSVAKFADKGLEFETHFRPFKMMDNVRQMYQALEYFVAVLDELREPSVRFERQFEEDDYANEFLNALITSSLVEGLRTSDMKRLYDFVEGVAVRNGAIDPDFHAHANALAQKFAKFSSALKKSGGKSADVDDEDQEEEEEDDEDEDEEEEDEEKEEEEDDENDEAFYDEIEADEEEMKEQIANENDLKDHPETFEMVRQALAIKGVHPKKSGALRHWNPAMHNKKQMIPQVVVINCRSPLSEEDLMQYDMDEYSSFSLPNWYFGMVSALPFVNDVATMGKVKRFNDKKDVPQEHRVNKVKMLQSKPEHDFIFANVHFE